MCNFAFGKIDMNLSIQNKTRNSLPNLYWIPKHARDKKRNILSANLYLNQL